MLCLAMCSFASCKCYKDKDTAISKYLKISISKNRSTCKDVSIRFSNQSDFLRFSIKRMAFWFHNPAGKKFVYFLPVQVELEPGTSLEKQMNFKAPRLFLDCSLLESDISIHCLQHQGQTMNAQASDPAQFVKDTSLPAVRPKFSSSQ